MTDRTPGHHWGHDGIIEREAAPNHGPTFWSDLETSLRSGGAGPTRGDERTSPMPVVAAGRSNGNTPDIRPAQPVPSRPWWPIAAAAALFAIVGLGFVVIQFRGDPTDVTEVVAAEPDVQATGGHSSGDTAVGDGAADGGADDASEDLDGNGQGPSAVESSQDSGVTEGSSTGSAAIAPPEPIGTPVPPLPDFEPAPGAVGEPRYLPLDQGVATAGVYLANGEGVTWYGEAQPGGRCSDAEYSEIKMVNASGITQPLRDPQLRFSGEVSHFAVADGGGLAAWVVGCGPQLELFVATMAPNGQVDRPTLAWIGEGLVNSALVLWDGGAVSLNAIEPGGTAFAVEYDTETGLLSRNGGPSRIMLEAGAPADRSLTPLAATFDGGLTYWAGRAPAGTVSECAALFGSGVSDTLWLRQGEGLWVLAIADDVPLGTVTAAALESSSTRLAIADVCEGAPGRLLIGEQRPDGRIVELQTLDMTPYVPGFIEQLFWVDANIVRIETNNTEFGFGTVRFDFEIDERVITQLD